VCRTAGSVSDTRRQDGIEYRVAIAVQHILDLRQAEVSQRHERSGGMEDRAYREHGTESIAYLMLIAAALIAM